MSNPCQKTGVALVHSDDLDLMRIVTSVRTNQIYLSHGINI